MARVDYYFSVISPFTYLAAGRLEQIAKRRGAEIAYKPMDILHVFSQTGGTPVGQRHPSRQAYRLQELTRGAHKAGLPIRLSPAHWPTDPLPASCAVIAVAEKGGKAGSLAQYFLSACWAKDRDIAEPAVVAEGLETIGEDAAALGEAMAAAEQTYLRFTDDAVANGVFGAPFYVVGEHRFWGQDRLIDLDAHLAGH
ncbi:MAG: 2-hydroxychromene-2-carboxylate isomerase [Pseudomonadota bacterium]